MATWQFDLYILPQPLARELSSDRNPDWEQFNDTQWWQGTPLAPIVEFCNARFARYPSWSSEQWLQWGHETSNRVDVSFDEDNTENGTKDNTLLEISVRLDAGNFDPAFLQNITDLALLLNGVFYQPRQGLIDPSPAALTAALHASPAARFVQNPRRFLNDLEENNDASPQSEWATCFTPPRLGVRLPTAPATATRFLPRSLLTPACALATAIGTDVARRHFAGHDERHC